MTGMNAIFLAISTDNQDKQDCICIHEDYVVKYELMISFKKRNI